MKQENKVKLSWEGKVADNPKPYGKATAGSEQVSIEHLVEVEKNMLELIEKLNEKISKLEQGSKPS